MSALLKVYTDAAHTSEVAHTTQNSTTVPAGGFALNATSATFGAGTIASWPTQGFFDIDTAGNAETIAYYGKSADTVQIANTGGFQHAHAAAVAVTQWYYQLAVGDQSNGIPNDGTEATPNSPTNVGTWYAYNAGDQTAQSITIATASGAPSTSQGFTDSLVSITSAAAGFATSVSPANMAAAAVTQFWVVAEIPNGQSAAGNPQICQVNISYQSI